IGGERLSQSDQARRTHFDDLGADRSGLLQLAGEIEPLSARRPLRRLPVFPNRQTAGAGLRPEMEVDQSRCHRSRTHPLHGVAGMAGSQGAQRPGATMKTAAIPLSVAFSVAGGIAFAQGASDPMAHLRACSLMERAERLQCLEELSRNIAPPAHPAPEGDNWIVSETTSPVDYAPVVTATAASRGGSDGSAMQLSIRCRGGRTELVVAGPAVSRSGQDYAISYRVNDDQPVQLAAGSPSASC